MRHSGTLASSMIVLGHWLTPFVAFSHVCYYIMVIQLHLPHMLCPSSAKHPYSKIACVNAAREVVTREISLRTFNPVTAVHRMSDFLALIAGMTLMLAHATSHCGSGTENLLVHQRLSDRAMVERALECCKDMSLQQDVLAARCAVVLQDLLAIEAEAAHEHKIGGGSSSNTDGSDRKLLIMKVPYIGGIQISRKGITAVAPSTIEQESGMQEGITLGGIGSVHVNTPLSPPQSTSGHTPQNVQMFDALLPQQQQEGSNSTPAALDNVFLQKENLMFPSMHPMFPPAAAGLDEWVLQGMG